MGDLIPIRPPQELYVDRKEIANILRVSPTTVARLVEQGMPSETWGLRARRFLPSQCLEWARNRTKESA